MPSPCLHFAPARPALAAAPGQPHAVEALLALLAAHLPVQRRTVHVGDVLHRMGQPFAWLQVVSVGLFKSVYCAADGRTQLVGLHGRGDWLGLDGMATGQHGSDALALDIGELWSLRYDSLLQAGALHPPLLAALHGAMSRDILRSQAAMLALCSLPAAARVADFLLNWANGLADHGQRTDHIRLRMTRADIGNHLGMTLESVSRALSGLERRAVIGFAGLGRRDILIPDLQVLAAVVLAGRLPALRPAAQLLAPPSAGAPLLSSQPAPARQSTGQGIERGRVMAGCALASG